PRNLVEGKWKKGGGRLGLLDVVNNGIAGTPMQAYKHLPLIDRWALVHYVRSISENPGKDDDATVAAKAKTIQ
ncbi:MAG: cytochrome c, partial [Bdellovibrionota bacterium]